MNKKLFVRKGFMICNSLSQGLQFRIKAKLSPSPLVAETGSAYNLLSVFELVRQKTFSFSPNKCLQNEHHNASFTPYINMSPIMAHIQKG